MMKKIIKILGVILLILLIGYIALIINTYFKIKQGDIVKWDGDWYTKEALKEKFPPQVYEVESKNTPEEVYATFRQALLDDDIEKALGVITDERKEWYKDIFSDKEKIKLFKEIPEVEYIKKRENDSYGNFSNYFYDSDDEDKIPYEISFVKNMQGYWEIDSI